MSAPNASTAPPPDALVLITPEPDFRRIEPSFSAARDAVGGFLEPVFLPTGDMLLVDEDGLTKQLPENRLASLVAGQLLVGPVVLVPRGLVRRVLDVGVEA